MRAIFVTLSIVLFCTCTSRKDSSPLDDVSSEAPPVAVLNAGLYALWFQFGPQGPEQIVSIEDACYSRALIPWPLAAHVRFMIAHGDDVIMAINGDGFLVLRSWDIQAGEQGTALYRFSGGDLWQLYTVAALVFVDEIPAALLYRDDRFLDTGAPLPVPRAWTFTMETSTPLALDIPALQLFPGHEGWDIDTLRFSSDGYWYYRVIKKDSGEQTIKYMRSLSLETDGGPVSSGMFHNSALPEPLAAAPPALSSLLGLMDFQEAVMVVSPDYNSQRYFAHNPDSVIDTLAYFRASPPSVLAINVQGSGLYDAGVPPLSAAPDAAVPRGIPLTLPSLPENFVYTGIALSGETIIAAWEEQEEYSTGAAGFMALRLR
jgi:hypothetical protein